MGKPPLLAKLISYHIYPGKNAAGGGVVVLQYMKWQKGVGGGVVWRGGEGAHC